jgi:hypothetical protein
MTSADPNVTDPMNSQGWNRYSYVGNDPLAFTDPNGFSWFSNFWHSVTHFFATNSIVRAIVQITIAAIVTVASGGNVVLAAAASAAITTGLSGGNLGQILKAGAIAGATAFAFGQIGPTPSFAVSPGQYLLNVGENALVGCASSVAGGQSCGSGAAAAAVSAGLSPYLPTDLAGGVIARATVGGLASVAGGGKFANGAITGAYQYLVSFPQASGRESGGESGHPNLMNANACIDACRSRLCGRIGFDHLGNGYPNCRSRCICYKPDAQR